MNAMPDPAGIRAKALELGYADCGVIPLEDMAGYDRKVAERVERFPESAAAFANHRRSLPRVRDTFPWAESVVICVRRYGKYRIPEAFKGRVGKFYLVDCRRDAACPDHDVSLRFEAHLRGLGLRLAFDRDYGSVGYRWAAMRAGLGIIRKNNFLYTEHGSWVDMEAWLVDADMELRNDRALPKCPDSCSLCVNACPTRSLAEPYMTNRESCVSNITTWKGRDMPGERYRAGVGSWLYGCDVCQDVCPFNRGKWIDAGEFPNLAEMAEWMDPPRILSAGYATLRRILAGKFWYIGEADIWKWKVNALNAMLNGYREEYRPHIEAALADEQEKVREMAGFALTNAPGGKGGGPFPGEESNTGATPPCGFPCGSA